MKLKRMLLALAVLASVAMPVELNSQPEVLEANCRACFPKPFIVTSRPFMALLTGDEVAEFKATLFSGTTYRIAVGNSGVNNIVFSVFDTNHNLLFSNDDFDLAPYWDFTVDGYLDCIVEARLDESVSSGFAVLMTGFRLDE